MKVKVEEVIKKLLKKVEESEDSVDAHNWAQTAAVLSCLRRDS